MDVIRHDASNKVPMKKRTISWANDLDNIREIPTTKLALKDEVIKEIKDMLLYLKRFIVIMLKRGQLCKLSELKEIYERNSKKAFDWQLKILPTLARLIHYIFISEQKSALKKDFLFEKIKQSDYTSTHLVSDFNRLVKQTGGWLMPFKEWVKRRSKYDINNVCDVF
jgi:hypothetical protein